MKIDSVQIPVDGETSLAGMVLTNPEITGKRPTILVIHGWKSQMSRYPERVKALVQMGYTAVLFDLRGHGETGGNLEKFSIKDHVDDCITAYDYMVSLENCDTTNISVFGSSYGGYLGCLLTAKRSVHHLALNVPALYSDEIFETPKVQVSAQTTEYRKRKIAYSENKALTALHSFSGGVLLIEAENDEVLIPQVMKNFRAAAPQNHTYHLIKDANHGMNNTPETTKMRNTVLATWFKKFV